MVGVLLGGAVLARADGGGVEALGQTVDQISEQIQWTLSEERVHNMFDWFRKLREFGLTYQSTLAAPSDLAGRLNEEQLRYYAGMKLFDALYAATFLQRVAVAESVDAIEQAQDRLDLRSYADLGNPFLDTLKQAAAAPQEVHLQELIQRLAADYVAELPALTSTPEGTAYLVDGLYGAVIQAAYIVNELYAGAPDEFEAGLRQHPSHPMYVMLLDLYAACERLDARVHVDGTPQPKLDVIREMFRLSQAEDEGLISPEEDSVGWEAVGQTATAIRHAILTPAE
jgi:hypothetical protein